MFGFLSKKKIKEEQRSIQRHMIMMELEDRDRKSHGGIALGDISMKYNYLGKEYTCLEYSLNFSGNIILGNEDYDIIFCCNKYEELIRFFTDLTSGKFN